MGLVLRRGRQAWTEQTLPRLLSVLGTPDPLPGPVWACGRWEGGRVRGKPALLVKSRTECDVISRQSLAILREDASSGDPEVIQAQTLPQETQCALRK